MDIVGGAYGGGDPFEELSSVLETSKSWLEGVLSGWDGLSQERRMEMVAASLLGLNRLQMDLQSVSGKRRPAVSDLAVEIVPERPNFVDLTVEERKARVKLEFRNSDLVGEAACRSGIGRDHAAPARATLEALQAILRDGLTLKDARVLQIADGAFAVVTLHNDERLLVGSAMIEDDLGVAMARATLDAANRFIQGMAPQDDRTIQLA